MVGISNASFGVARLQLKTVPAAFAAPKPLFGDSLEYHKKEAGFHKFSSFMWAALGSIMILCGLQSANIIPNKDAQPRPANATSEFSIAGMDALIAGSHVLQARKQNKLAQQKSSEIKPG